MAQYKISMIMVLSALLWAGVAAQSSCTNVLISLSPCLNYITGNSSTPSSGCCSQLATVVRSQPECLCQVLNGGASSLGINVNQTQALALPRACNVQTPSVARCNGAAPSDAPSGSPETPNADVPAGSKTEPSPGDASSSGNSIKLSVPLFFFVSASVLAVP